MQGQQSDIEWRTGDVPVSRHFDDPYYSLDNGLAETRHVFLAGNDLPARFRDGFHIAELGFGTGLNLLATIKEWRDHGASGTLRYTAFEAFPLTKEHMVRAQAAFPEMQAITEELSHHWGKSSFSLPDLDFELISGDARETLPRWNAQADAWYLDGFSPAKNPELWEESLLQAVGLHTAPGGSAATYTAAGHVRRALQAAGFETTRTAGFGRKRHMTQARKV